MSTAGIDLDGCENRYWGHMLKITLPRKEEVDFIGGSSVLYGVMPLAVAVILG
jgi:hypothetical protein